MSMDDWDDYYSDEDEFEDDDQDEFEDDRDMDLDDDLFPDWTRESRSSTVVPGTSTSARSSTSSSTRPRS